jgi:hypothetical protein
MASTWQQSLPTTKAWLRQQPQLITFPAPAASCCFCFLAQEAAAGNALYDVRYKLLNIGLLSAGIGHLLVLQPRLGNPEMSGSLLPVIVGTWAAAALLGGVGLLKRAQKA